MISNIKIGSDPELFIVDTTTNKVVSSIGIIPGEKGKAFKPKGFKKGFGLQVDNILAEFNIPPVNTEQAFVDNMTIMKDYIRDFVKQHNPNLDILCKASELVDEDQLQSKESQEFGCTEDYNVYTESANPRPNGVATNLRTTGVHVHVSYDNVSIKESLMVIKYMDAFLGLPSIIYDKDNRRRELYGKAGCFRLCPYGFEYRTLSGYWLDTEESIRWVYKQTMAAIAAYNAGWNLPKYSMTEEAINTGNVELAKELLEKYNIKY